MIQSFLKLLRVKHWVKNLLIFMPPFFGGVINNLDNIYILTLSFLNFSISASIVYIFNDIIDIENDKLHPQKKKRPLASGTVKIKEAIILIILLFILIIIFSLNLPNTVVFITAFYILLNLLYSFYLKKVPIIELFVVASGFVIRVFIGGLAVNILVSKWLIMLTFFTALYIILSKRRGEILNDEAIHSREVLNKYSESYLTFSMIIISTISILAYIMYTVDAITIERYASDKIYLTTIFMVFIFLRHLQQTLLYNNTESPIKYFFSDKLNLLVIALWLATYYFLIYIL